jgi:hypothetical protein
VFLRWWRSEAPGGARQGAPPVQTTAGGSCAHRIQCATERPCAGCHHWNGSYTLLQSGFGMNCWVSKKLDLKMIVIHFRIFQYHVAMVIYVIISTNSWLNQKLL